jgi:transposase
VKRYYYTDKFKTDGKTLGPVSIEELEQLYIKQEITEKCLVCIEGTEEWQSFIEVLTQFNEQKRELRKEERGKLTRFEKIWRALKGEKMGTVGFIFVGLLGIVLVSSVLGGAAGLIVMLFVYFMDGRSAQRNDTTPCANCGAKRGYYLDGGGFQRSVWRCKNCNAVK